MAHSVRDIGIGTRANTSPTYTESITLTSGSTVLVVFIMINGVVTRAGGAPSYNGSTMTDSGQGSINQGGGETTNAAPGGEEVEVDVTADTEA